MTILSERPLRRPVCALKLRNNVLQRGRSRWPCGLRSEPATVWLLGSRFQIALRTWMFVPCVCLQCVGSGLCDELIIRSKTFYQLCLCASACVCVCVCVCVCGWVCLTVCDLHISKMRRPGRNVGCCATKTNLSRAHCRIIPNYTFTPPCTQKALPRLLTFRM